MNSKRKSILVAGLLAFLIVLTALPGMAAAEETAPGLGYVPVDKDAYVVTENQRNVRRLNTTATGNYPVAYRSDTQPWAAGIQVKDQGSSGICWALSTVTAAEYSYAKEVYDTTGQIAYVQETSGAHLAQFLFNRVDDPLGNTTNDINGLSNRTEHWSTGGGNQLFATQHLATWSGACLEAKAPIGSALQYIDDYGRWTNSAIRKVYDDSLAYDDYLVQENSIAYFEADEALVKNLVYTYGAVSTSIAWEDQYLNLNEIDPATGTAYDEGRSFYCYDEEPGLNHAVTIVGWDDSYPKENFTHSLNGKSAEASATLTTPSRDGAWIIQNSWGSDYNDGGFVYVSYDSIDFRKDNNDAYVFDMQPADTYAYNFQYDGTAYCADSTDTNSRGRHYDYYTTAGTRAANVFTNTTGSAIKLEAVGFTTFNEGTTVCDISVYTNLSNTNDPTSGSLVSTTRYTTTSVGCKTATLSTPAVVRAGQTFSIVFSFPETTAFGVEVSYRDSDWNIQAQTNAGQSFFSAAGSTSWTDMKNYSACFRIKGFANITEDPGHEPGWAYEDNAWRYYNTDGTMLTNTFIESNGSMYYLDANGGMVANAWVAHNGRSYYVGTDGAMVANAWVKHNGRSYYVGADGAMVSNTWVKHNNSYYYLGADGAMLVNSWVKYNNSYYYLGANGTVTTNSWVYYGGKYYFVGSNGKAVAKTWIIWNGKYYFINAKGNPVVNGWVKWGGKYYYLNAKGNPVVGGWIAYNGAYYYFNAKGVCVYKLPM